jgi:hypothetical protein
MSKRALRIIVAVAIVALFVVATLALPRRPAPVAAAPAVQPVAPQPVSESSPKRGLSQAEKDRIAESPTPAAAVAAISEALGKLDSTTIGDPSSKVEGRSSK